MIFDFYLVAKIILIVYIWALTALCILFILNSKKIYSDLKTYEDHFRKKKREVEKAFMFFQSAKLGIDLTKKMLLPSIGKILK